MEKLKQQQIRSFNSLIIEDSQVFEELKSALKYNDSFLRLRKHSLGSQILEFYNENRTKNIFITHNNNSINLQKCFR